MNQNNLVNLGQWLQRKLRALFRKKDAANARMNASGLSQSALQLEWEAQKHDAVQQAPSKHC